MAGLMVPSSPAKPTEGDLSEASLQLSGMHTQDAFLGLLRL